MKLYVITFEVNDYDQYGEYLHSVHLTEKAALAAVPYFGRKIETTRNDGWYTLHILEPGEVYQEVTFLPPIPGES
jgi:hypothetical protein